jgi:protoheme IX farnesyltransferase
MNDAVATPVVLRSAASARWAAFVELAKPRIAALVLVATAVGYYLAIPAGPWSDADSFRLLLTLLGTALVAAGANALNQVLEAGLDSLMQRTRFRPIPTGRMTGREAAFFGIAVGIIGLACLAFLVNVLAAALAAISLLTYVLVYTPMKQMSSVCVWIGAISGALPPVIGWAGGAGALHPGAWLLFAILFFWQLPHFASISWLYRDDYGRAGYPLIPVIHGGGVRFDLHLMSHAVTLLAVSILPVAYGLAGVVYAAGAMFLGTLFLAYSLYFVLCKTPRTARGHVIASVVYLPALLGTMMLDRGLPL